MITSNKKQVVSVSKSSVVSVFQQTKNIRLAAQVNKGVSFPWDLPPFNSCQTKPIVFCRGRKNVNKPGGK